MPDDNSQELRIHIISDADTKGFQQASAAGNKLKVDTSDLSDETKRQLGLLPQLEAGMKKSGEATTEAGLAQQEVKKVLLEIGNVAAPGAGRALMELAFGPVGIGLALAQVYEVIKEKLDEIDEAAKKLDDLEFDKHQSNIESIRKNWADAKAELDKYDAAVKAAGEEQDPNAERLKLVQAVSEAQTAANIKELEELGKIRVAWLKAHGATDDQIANAEASTAAEIQATKDAGAKRSLQNIQADIDQRTKNQPNLDAAVYKAEGAVTEAKNKLGLIQSNIADTENKPEAAAFRKKLKDAQEAASEAYGLSDDNPEFKKTQIAYAEAQLAPLTEEQKRREDALKVLREQEAAAQKNLDNATDAWTRARAAGLSNAATVTREKGEVKIGRAVGDVGEHGTAVNNLLNTQIPAVHQTLGAVLTAAGRSNETIERLLNGVINHQVTLQAVVDSALQRLAQIQAQGKSTATYGQQ